MRYPGQQDGAGLRPPPPANYPWLVAPSQMPPEHMMPQGHHPMAMRNPNPHMSQPPCNMPPPFHAPVTNVGFPAGFSPHPGGMPFMRPPPQGPPPSYLPHDRTCAPPHTAHGPPDAASDVYGQPVDCNDWTSVTPVNQHGVYQSTESPVNQHGVYQSTESPVNQHGVYQSPERYGHQIDADTQFQSRDGYESSRNRADTPRRMRSPSHPSSRFRERRELSSNSHSSENRRGDSRRDSMRRESRSPDSSRRSRSEIVTCESRSGSARRQSRCGTMNRDSRSEVTNRQSRSGVRTGESRSNASRESRPGGRSDAVTSENRSDVTRESRSWSDSRSNRPRGETDNQR